MTGSESATNTAGLPMNTAQLSAELARITYRPGWCLRVHEHPFDGPTLRIEAEVLDSRHPDQTITLGITSRLPPMYTPEELHRYLTWRLSLIESHECREWLQRDGAPINDPHQGDFR